MIRSALVVVCVLLTAGCVLHRGGGQAKPAAPLDAGTIRVFITTAAPHGRVLTGDEVTRQRTVALLADRLAGRKGLAVITAPAQADVVVDVHSPASLLDPHAGKKFDENAVPVDVRGAGQTTRIIESGYDRTRTIGKVAKDIHRWIQANYSKIIAARQPAR